MPKKTAKKSTKKTIFEGSLSKQGVVAEKDEFLESEEHEGTHEDNGLRIQIGDKEADIYTEEGREELEESEEVAPWEEAFAEGATGKGEKGVCANCGKPLPQEEDKVIEQEYRGDIYWFCSQKCAKAGVKKE